MSDTEGSRPPERYSERLDDAFSLARRLHADQVRKGTRIPYLSHLLAVAALAAENGGTEDQVIAALLHDAVEDQGGLATLSSIRDRFGPAVAEMVLALSDAVETPKPPWRERKERYLAHLESAPPGVLLVSLCDKVHNARSIAAGLREEGIATLDRFRGGREGTLWYYRRLGEIFSARRPGPLTGELLRLVEEMHRRAG